MLLQRSYPVASNEAQRLQEALTYSNVAADGDISLDEICTLAQRLFNVPIALITLVRDEDQRFLARCGVEGEGTPRNDAFCTFTILSDEVLVVNDARQDDRFAVNPLVTGPMNIRFYAGAPLVVRDGVRIGALCLIDVEPRAFSPDDAQRLKTLAGLAVNELRRRRALLDLRREQEFLAQAGRMAKVGSWSFEPASRALQWSVETYRILGIDPDQAPTTTLAWRLCKRIWRKRAERAWVALLRRGEAFDRNVPIVTMSGEPRWVRIIAEAERINGRVARIAGSIQDITEQRANADRIERLAYRDALTELPNRALFQERLQSAVLADRVRPSGLVLLGVDQFKQINDTVGHGAGDEVLKRVARFLNRACASVDTVARVGGDEFALILVGIVDEADLMHRAQALLESVRAIKPLGFPLSASAGAVLLRPGQAASAALQEADLALQHAKAAGRGRAACFAPGMRAALDARITQVRDVRESLAAHHFVLHYQPIVAIGDVLSVAGFEALLRWRHPSRGVLAPGQFEAALHDPELSLALGDVVLEQAIAQMRTWLDAGLEFGRVAVNVAAAQFHSGALAQSVLDKLQHWRVAPARLTLEITEHVSLGWGAEAVADAVNTLHAAGVMIALDDFGTGYASLASLNQFPIDYLKIDKSFVQDSGSWAIARATASLGHSLKMKIVAEGVENGAQLAAVQAMGCDKVQGYYFSPPLPAAQAAEFLRAFQANRGVEKRLRQGARA